MTTEIFINAGVGEVRVALVKDGRLEELSFERTIGAGEGAEEGRHGCASLVGDVVLGRVQRVMPSMQAAFVDIGLERAGFLALRKARARGAAPDCKISDCVREGEAVLVQVIKDPIGDKGARLSAGVTLPGRLLVMTPSHPGLALSRRIEDGEMRAGLMLMGQRMLQEVGDRLVPGAGFIFRTSTLGTFLDELSQDALALSEVWRGILERRKSAHPPVTLYRDLGPIERTLRDLVRGRIGRVLIDEARAAEAARAYCGQVMPGAACKIELVAPPLFDDTLEAQIAALSRPRVELASGAWITIETTEALTAVDVNSGGFTQASGLEETSLAVNLEAASEIGRQIRLRGIGGLIVVDFIHLSTSGHAARVCAALAESLSFDRTPVQISPMSEFGIVAVTRKRVRVPLARLTSGPCPTCRGTGWLATPESVALDLLRRVEREARAAPGREILISAAPEVVAWLDAHDGQLREALARSGVGRVRFEEGAMPREAFDVRPV